MSIALDSRTISLSRSLPCFLTRLKCALPRKYTYRGRPQEFHSSRHVARCPNSTAFYARISPRIGGMQRQKRAGWRCARYLAIGACGSRPTRSTDFGSRAYSSSRSPEMTVRRAEAGRTSAHRRRRDRGGPDPDAREHPPRRHPLEHAFHGEGLGALSDDGLRGSGGPLGCSRTGVRASSCRGTPCSSRRCATWSLSTWIRRTGRWCCVSTRRARVNEFCSLRSCYRTGTWENAR